MIEASWRFDRRHYRLPGRLAGLPALSYDAAPHLPARRRTEETMANDVMTLSQQKMKVGHSSAKKPVMSPGRREFFSYRDLCIKDASGGAMRGQVMKAKTSMTQPTGWHYHTCEGQFVYLLNGWVELEFETGETLRCEKGDSIYIPGGLKHNELRTSDDFEALEVSVPGELGTVSCEKPA
jgi:quercetin dioxygenase-like cupin family protein